MELQPIKNIITGFLKTCLESIESTSANGPAGAMFCLFCGQEKIAFINPMPGMGVEILECECERHFKMLEEFLAVNYEWIAYPDKKDKTIPNYDTATNPQYERAKQRAFVLRVKAERDFMLQRKREEVDHERDRNITGTRNPMHHCQSAL